jgi:hypothetical protein
MDSAGLMLEGHGQTGVQILIKGYFACLDLAVNRCPRGQFGYKCNEAAVGFSAYTMHCGLFP